MSPTPPKGFVLFVTPAFGSSYTSELAVEISRFIAANTPLAKKLCLVNMSTHPGATERTTNHYGPGLTELLSASAHGAPRLDHFLVSTAFGFDALACGAPHAPLSPSQLSALTARLRAIYDYLVVLTPTAERYNSFFTGYSLKTGVDSFTLLISSNTVSSMSAISFYDEITELPEIDDPWTRSRIGALELTTAEIPAQPYTEGPWKLGTIVLPRAMTRHTRGAYHPISGSAPAFDSALEGVLRYALGSSSRFIDSKSDLLGHPPTPQISQLS